MIIATHRFCIKEAITMWACACLQLTVSQKLYFFKSLERNRPDVLIIYTIGREGPSRFLFNTISFPSPAEFKLARSFAGLEILRNWSSFLALPRTSSVLRFGLGDADLIPLGVFLELFRRGNPFRISLRSRSTMHPSCSSSKGRGFPFFTLPPAFAFRSASSCRFFSRAFRLSSWMRNCSFSYQTNKKRNHYFDRRHGFIFTSRKERNRFERN